MKTEQPAAGFLWAAPAWRALLEAALLFGLLLWLLIPSLVPAPELAVLMAFLVFGILCGGIAGLRLRQRPGPWRRTLALEALLTCGLSLSLLASALLVLALTEEITLLEHSLYYPVVPLLMLALSGPAFAGVRLCSYLWQWWSALRRRRFAWELTHALLMVVIILGALGMVLGLVFLGYLVINDLQTLSTIPPDPTYSVFVRVIIWSLLLIFFVLGFTALGMVLMLPPALFFSYRVARGLTRRLDRLSDAATRMRSGDLSARVPVEGQDEVAQLQANFNSMAGDLERRTQELQESQQSLTAERDRVAGLLNAHRELAASVSHELRTPLAIAGGQIESALTHSDSLDEATRHGIQLAAAELDHLNCLIDDLFTLSRAEVDRLTLQIKPIDPAPFLLRLVEASQGPAWENRRVQVTAELPPHLPHIAVDPVRLEQIVRNLLQNGLRHTPPGGYILLTAGALGERLHIEVEDSGEGINESDQPHVWERFYQSAAARGSGQGAGLGLALVKELTEAMNGQVGFDSRPGEGSRFWVAFPLFTEGE